jgi:hypothetical protein
MRVVRVRRRQISHCGFALHVDEIFVVVNVEHRFERLDNAPHNDGRNFDGIAVALVDLQPRALEIPHAQ